MQPRKFLLSAAMFAGLIMGSTGCEVLTKPDRSQIDTGLGGSGGGGGAGGAACVLVDDMNECTDDVCTDGTTTHTPKAAGAECTTGGTQCDGNGQCVGCIVAADCPGTDDACQVRVCTLGACSMDFTAVNTPLPTQTPGDCKVDVCDGNGATKQDNDDADLPDDSKACTTDACSMGTPSNTNAAQGADCTPPGGPDPLVCNNMGECTGCNSPSDCPGTDDECSARTCVAGVCGVSFAAKDKPVMAQTNNNCLVHVCDGAGNFVDIADNADVPLDDGNACTGETCSAGAPMHPSTADGSVCNDGDGCTQADTCQLGICTGANPVICVASDECHNPGTCFSSTGMCSTPAKLDGSACNDGNSCTQTDTCQAGTCAGANPVTCAASDQCHDAGTCNVTTGMCSNPPKTNGTACTDNNACTQTDTCQSGTCSGANPVTCSASDQCHDAGTCDTSTGTCSNPSKPNGSACTDNNSCTQSDTCQTGTCTGANPVTCMALDQCHVVGTCNSGTGTCNDPNAPNGTACTVGGTGGVCSVGVCSLCGNNMIDANEQCDDGNTTNGDGCSAACLADEIEPNNMCGQASTITLAGTPLSGSIVGSINPIADEDWYSFTIPGSRPRGVKIETFVGGSGMCVAATNSADTVITLYKSDCTTEIGNDDDGGLVPCSLIDPTVNDFAQSLLPGTYYVNVIRYNNTAIINEYELALSLVTTCGDSVVEPGEACDDGNFGAGDGCSATCGVELGYACDGSPSVCVRPEVYCDDGVDNNGNGLMDAADPTCMLPTYFSACGAGEYTLVLPSEGSAQDIPEDPDTLTSDINVNVGGTIARAAVLFNITHTYAGDVDLYLTPPGGTALDIATGNGAGGEDFVNTLLDSTCALPIDGVANTDAPFSDCYAPETSFAALNGTAATGTWTLTATDNFALVDYGTLNNWSLVLCVPVASNCATLLAANPGLPDGDYTIDPDGTGGNAPFTARCDMTTDGGGWTLAFNDGPGFNETFFGAGGQTGYSTNFINLAYSTVAITNGLMFDASDSDIVDNNQEHRSIIATPGGVGQTLRAVFNGATSVFFDADDNANVTSNVGLTCGSFGKWADYEAAVCGSTKVLVGNDTTGASNFSIGTDFSSASSDNNAAGWPQDPNNGGTNYLPDNFRVWVR